VTYQTLAHLAALALVAAAGCHRNTSARLAAVPVEARDFFSSRCASCHGIDGSGNGPAAASLNPHPRNFGDPSWQRGVTDERLRRVIVEGGAAVGGSFLMPPNPDLRGRPDMVGNLVALIRALGPATN
jgi:mono/diheme cytochrome c family protein